VRTITLQDEGSARWVYGLAGGESRRADAAKAAISSPLLEESVTERRGIRPEHHRRQGLACSRATDAAEIIQNAARPATRTRTIFGAVIDREHVRTRCE